MCAVCRVCVCVCVCVMWWRGWGWVAGGDDDDGGRAGGREAGRAGGACAGRAGAGGGESTIRFQASGRGLMLVAGVIGGMDNDCWRAGRARQEGGQARVRGGPGRAGAKVVDVVGFVLLRLTTTTCARALVLGAWLRGRERARRRAGLRAGGRRHHAWAAGRLRGGHAGAGQAIGDLSCCCRQADDPSRPRGPGPGRSPRPPPPDGPRQCKRKCSKINKCNTTPRGTLTPAGADPDRPPRPRPWHLDGR